MGLERPVGMNGRVNRAAILAVSARVRSIGLQAIGMSRYEKYDPESRIGFSGVELELPKVRQPQQIVGVWVDAWLVSTSRHVCVAPCLSVLAFEVNILRIVCFHRYNCQEVGVWARVRLP